VPQLIVGRKNMTTSPTHRASKKAMAIFKKAFGERAAHLFTGASTIQMGHTITAAFARHVRREKAQDIGFHLGDWAHDAALILALHMFPEKFSREEIRRVTDFVAAGLPYHAAALATHFGYEGLARDGIREVKRQERPTKRSRQQRPAV
jgi:hypothetical protein